MPDGENAKKPRVASEYAGDNCSKLYRTLPTEREAIMKVIFIFLALHVLTLGFGMAIDLMTGFSLRDSLSNLKNPFEVMSAQERLIVCLFLIAISAAPFLPSLTKNSSRKKPNNGKRN
ncbi:hypothetical protein [Paenibacillus sp. GYB003]|uniref:hypothetical protein n=1 Tax=Paenibacillus sp. GYB003 TaxID=2994392 RepID=UPI002F962B34